MLTVLMATRNGAGTLPTVLDAYTRLSCPDGGWRMVIVDNGSTDATKDIVHGYRDRLPLVYMFEPRGGKNTALNTGLDSIAGDLVVFTDDDTVPCIEWLSALRSAADSRPGFHLFGGPIHPRWPHPPEDWMKVVPFGPTFTSLRPLAEGPIPARLVFGPNMALRSEIFDRGYRFDETIGPAGTDYPMGSEAELTRKLAGAGYRAWHCRAAAVEHLIRPQQMTKTWVLRRAIRYGRGQYRLTREHYAQRFSVVALLIQVLAQACRLGCAALSLDRNRLFERQWTLNCLLGQLREASRPAGVRGESPAPLLPDVGVIALVPDVWQRMWQPRQQVLTRLARYFHVVWCDRPHDWRASLTLGRRRRRIGSDAPAPANLVVYRPERWLPAVGRIQFIGRWTLRHRLLRAAKILRSRGCRRIVLYVWRPEHGPALDLVDHQLSCYHIDDEYTFSRVEQPIPDDERRLIVNADRVFIHSAALLEKKGSLNPRTVFVPNGVDFRAYSTAQAEPEDLRAIPHPRVGYVGRIKAQLDLQLLERLAVRHPTWSFVFVGPLAPTDEVKAWAERMSKMPNVHFLGQKLVERLPAYTQHLDVNTMCYVMNDYTKFIYPLKLHEYLASGRPVVATPIRSLHEFASVIELATTESEWSAALARALAPEARSTSRVKARRDVARAYDWDDLVHKVAREMSSGLGPSSLAQFDAAYLAVRAGMRSENAATEDCAPSRGLTHQRLPGGDA